MMAEVLLAISYATRPKLVNGGGMWSTIKMEGYDGGGSTIKIGGYWWRVWSNNRMGGWVVAGVTKELDERLGGGGGGQLSIWEAR
jgi:hypothetical protein